MLSVFRSQSRRLTFRYLSTKYTKSHEWIKKDANTVTVGITDFAQKTLGDVVYVETASEGQFEKGQVIGSVESVKAASDIYAPLSLKITENNEKLQNEPALVNQSAEDEAWFIKGDLIDPSEFDSPELLSKEDYDAHCQHK